MAADTALIFVDYGSLKEVWNPEYALPEPAE